MTTMVSHSGYLTVRAVRALVRQPVFLIITLMQPIIWLLLFGQLFSKVVEIPGFDGLVPNRPVRIFVSIVTVLTVLGLTYFGVLGFVDPAALAPGGDAEAATTFAGYMAARNVVMGVAALALLALRAWRALSVVLALNAAVQVLDTVLGLARADVPRPLHPR